MGARFTLGLLLAMATSTGCLAADPAKTAADMPKETLEPKFFIFSDTQVSYRYVFPAAEPGVSVRNANGQLEGRGIPKNVLNVFHTNTWAYGTNLVSVDILKSGSQDPAGSKFQSFPDQGATEVYGLYRGTLSFNKIFDTKTFAVSGLVKDVALSYGADLNTKDTRFGPEKRLAVAGLSFAIDVPVGFLNVRVHASKEWNRNGFGLGDFRSVEYKWAPEFEMAFSFPLAFTGLPISIAGFNNVILPKGSYGTLNQFQTKTEWLSRTNLVLDVGKLVYGQPNKIDAFVGFQYWLNKFGNNPRNTINTEEKAFLAGFAFHAP
ncbi:hypothetical protein [Methylobacterium radiodurans]|uniref:Uncharacterized protein n=1 Tax=Methylobacterium radiodurans TaxID=2202828 RepID=A0A2U8VNA1_9HYPH|nr:hypothetical protein [Methylobacterium radiodurans]AWN35077.1 hypothetical protein DK427_04405 [Methylobacterium radiodurans]